MNGIYYAYKNAYRKALKNHEEASRIIEPKLASREGFNRQLSVLYTPDELQRAMEYDYKTNQLLTTIKKKEPKVTRVTDGSLAMKAETNIHEFLKDHELPFIFKKSTQLYRIIELVIQ